MTEPAKAALAQAKSGLAGYRSERSATVAGLVVEQDKKVASLESDLEKAKLGMELQTLTAPVDGMVGSLAVHTVDGVVTGAQPVVTIVPTGTPLVIEADVNNKDIGYVAVGQAAALKFDAFSFQQYGTVPAKVSSLSPDAVDGKNGSPAVYKANLSFGQKTMRVHGRDVAITPGMAVTAEVKTGKRRIIQFFFDPLIKKSNESLKVR